MLKYCIAFVPCLILSFILGQHCRSPNDYASVVMCEVVGETSNKAAGEMFTLVLDESKPVMLQKSVCINLDDTEVGDFFMVVVAYDKDDTIMSVTKVSE